MDRQLQIKFERARQFGIIKNWCPQTIQKVSGRTLKIVLNQINQYGNGSNCFASQSRLATECGITERTFRRAIEVLEGLGVLCVQRSKVADGQRITLNRYTIVWTELEMMVERMLYERPDKASPAEDFGAEKPEIPKYQPDMVSDQPDTGVLQDCISKYYITTTAPLTPQVESDRRWRRAAADEFFEKPKNEPDAPQRPSPVPAAVCRGTRQPESEIERMLAYAGIEQWATCAAEFEHVGREAIGEAIAWYRANHGLFRGPQAIVHFLRNGSWPAKGVVSPEEAERRLRAEAHRTRSNEAQREAKARAALRDDIVISGRRNKLSNREIGQQLVARGLDPEGFLEDQS